MDLGLWMFGIALSVIAFVVDICNVIASGISEPICLPNEQTPLICEGNPPVEMGLFENTTLTAVSKLQRIFLINNFLSKEECDQVLVVSSHHKHLSCEPT